MQNFHDVPIDELLNSGSLKWSLFPDCIGMWLAEMDYRIAPEIGSVLQRFVSAPGVGYRSPEQTATLKDVTATWYSQSFDVSVTPDQVRIAPDVISLFAAVVQQFTKPGEKIIMPTPGYMAFIAQIPALGRTCVEIPSHIVNGRYQLDLDAIRTQLEAGAKMFILVNPGNPVGRVYPRAELEELDALLSEFPEVKVFSDEIHAPLVLEGQHIPYASVSSNAASQSITAVSASKGWNIPGLKTAQAIVTNPRDAELLQPLLALLDSATPTLGVVAATVALRDSGQWLSDTLEYLRINRNFIEERIGTIDGVSMTHVEGTYIALLDFTDAYAGGKIPQHISVAEFLKERAGVALTDGDALGQGYPHLARLVFATSREILTEAIRRIEVALS